MRRSSRVPLALALLVTLALACSPFGAEETSELAPEGGISETGASDAGAEGAGSCPRTMVSQGGLFSAFKTTAKNIDGRLDDWPCERFSRLDKASAGKSLFGDSGGYADVSAAWDANSLYLAVRVRDPSVRSGAASNAHPNDCLHVYLDGDGVFDGTYGEDTKMVVFDHKGTVTRYRPQPEINGVLGITSKVVLAEGGFDLEIAITAAFVGQSGFRSDQLVGFDFAAADGNGTSTFDQFLVWNWGISCGGKCECTSESTPNCNTLHFGKLRLEP